MMLAANDLEEKKHFALGLVAAKLALYPDIHEFHQIIQDCHDLAAKDSALNFQYGSQEDTLIINQRIRFKLIRLLESNLSTRISDSLYACLIALARCWPVNRFEEDEGHYRCIVTLEELNPATSFCTSSGRCYDMSALTEMIYNGRDPETNAPYSSREMHYLHSVAVENDIENYSLRSHGEKALSYLLNSLQYVFIPGYAIGVALIIAGVCFSPPILSLVIAGNICIDSACALMLASPLIGFMVDVFDRICSRFITYPREVAEMLTAITPEQTLTLEQENLKQVDVTLSSSAEISVGLNVSPQTLMSDSPSDTDNHFVTMTDAQNIPAQVADDQDEAEPCLASPSSRGQGGTTMINNHR